MTLVALAHGEEEEKVDMEDKEWTIKGRNCKQGMIGSANESSSFLIERQHGVADLYDWWQEGRWLKQ